MTRHNNDALGSNASQTSLLQMRIEEKLRTQLKKEAWQPPSGYPVERQTQMRRSSGLTGSTVLSILQQKTVQRKASASGGESIHAVAQRGTQGASRGLPHAERIQASFGRHDVSGVKAAVGGEAAHASKAMGALAYASGNTVAFAESPGLHLAAHEATHVVQQRAGVSLKGGVGQVGDRYEQHADAVADLVVQGKSAESLLDTMAPGAAPIQKVSSERVQMWSTVGTERYGLNVPDVAEAAGVDCDAPSSERSIPEDLTCGAQSAIDHANNQVATIPIEVGSEAEWRRALTGGSSPTDQRRIGAFLRSAVNPNSTAWEAWTYAHLADIAITDPIIRRMVGGDLNDIYLHLGHPSRELQGGITATHKHNFVKVLYEPGSQALASVGRGPNAELFQRFIAENQGDVVEGYAASGRTIDSAPLANNANDEQRYTMIGSAGGSICAAVRKYACAESATNADQERIQSLRMINRAGQLIRDTVNVCQRIERARIERAKALMGIALAAIPIPGLSGLGEFVGRAAAQRVVQKLLTTTRDNLRNHYAAALAGGGSPQERLSTIRNNTIEEIEALGLRSEHEATLRQELNSSIQ